MKRFREKLKRAVSTSKKRMALVITLLSALFLVLILRIALVSIGGHEAYSDLAIAQQLRDTVITARRGTIYDANMNVLAESAPCWTVTISPLEIAEEDAELVASALSETLGTDYETVLAQCEEENYYSVVRRKVDEPVVEQLRAVMREQKIGGINFTEDSKRYYPYGRFAAHVLGFVGTDNYGLAGLEAYYDAYLSGTSGRMITAQNAVGTEMFYESKTEYGATEGYSLVLTMDEVVQHYLESALDSAVREHNVQNRVAGIVMNVKTGAILAMATKGDYDPNNPFQLYDEAAYETLGLAATEEEYGAALQYLQQRQWNNKAISEAYEPGSVFKTVTAAIALETNSSDLNSEYYCAGSIEVADRTMYCAIMAHGMQTFSECLIHSCNPGFVQIGQGIGREQFYSYFQNFGLTQHTGIDLPGEGESIYYSADEMGIVELSSASYGQSNSVTPIQMITSFAAVVNGGYLLQPHIVDSVIDGDGNVIESFGNPVKRQVISGETSDQMRLMLEEVVENASNISVPGYRIGGKSGTSQKLAGDDDRAFVASFCIFAPVDDPEIAILVMLDEAKSYSIYGTTLVGPIVANVMANVLPYYGIDPVYTEEELENEKVGVPNVTGGLVSNAFADIQQKGLNYVLVGEGLNIVYQYPQGGFAMPRGSTVYIYTEGAEEKFVKVPDVVGQSAGNATTLLRNAGLNIEVNGESSGTVAVIQSVPPDQEVTAGTVVTVDFVDQSHYD